MWRDWGISSSNLKHSEDFGSSEGNGGWGNFLEEVASEMTLKDRDGERACLVEGIVN